MTFTTHSTATRVTPMIDTSTSAQAVTFYLDAIQLEEGTLTTWVPGGESAILIEEGATNLLTANQSDVEVDATGFLAVGGATTLTRVTTEKWEGAASLQVVTNGSATYEGLYIQYPTSTGGTYTASVYIKGSGLIAFWTRIVYTDTTIEESTRPRIKLNFKWQRIKE